MTAPQSAPWDSLPPWEKAAQWYAIAPHIADEIVAQSRELSQREWEFRIVEARHRRAMELELAAHNRLMDRRLWVTQMVAFVVGLANVAALSVVAWHYADTGNLVPGLTLLGAGTSVTVGIFAIGRSLIRRRAATAHPQASPVPPQSNSGSNG